MAQCTQEGYEIAGVLKGPKPRKISKTGRKYPKNLLGALKIIDPLMGLFRGAVFRHGGGARKQPIKQPTEMPTSTMALMGRFP